ncbi:MAG TPA: biopolymer transporter ExbD [Bacteroidetes bacterium]|nr:biopolymer transporter ExbD [Bacteroidota bacterium]
MAKRKLEEINAGSMADIAFLLLIFFLVTTTMESNYGIRRKLPPPPDPSVDIPVIKMKNVLEIVINGQDKMLIEEKPATVKDVKKIAMDFITNNGKDPSSSDNPQKAVISIKQMRETSYKEYISVYNELISAYNVLRNKYAQKKFGKSFDQLTEEQQKTVKDFYPQKIAESMTK